MEYKYDAFDRRLSRHVDAEGNGSFETKERFVYDTNVSDPSFAEVIMILDDTNNYTEESRFLQGAMVDQVFAEVSSDTGGNVEWLLPDHQDTIRDVFDYESQYENSNGQEETTVTSHLTYDSFGRLVEVDDPETTADNDGTYDGKFSYTGREWDEVGELFYYRSRWYDPAAQRFVSEETIGFASGDVNPFRYTANSAINATDPSGNVIQFGNKSVADRYVKMLAELGITARVSKPSQDGTTWVSVDPKDAQRFIGYVDRLFGTEKILEGIDGFCGKRPFVGLSKQNQKLIRQRNRLILESGIFGNVGTFPVNSIGNTVESANLDAIAVFLNGLKESGSTLIVDIGGHGTASPKDPNRQRPNDLGLTGVVNVNIIFGLGRRRPIDNLIIREGCGGGLIFGNRSVDQLFLQRTEMIGTFVDEDGTNLSKEIVRVIKNGGVIKLESVLKGKSHHDRVVDLLRQANRLWKVDQLLSDIGVETTITVKKK